MWNRGIAECCPRWAVPGESLTPFWVQRTEVSVFRVSGQKLGRFQHSPGPSVSHAVPPPQSLRTKALLFVLPGGPYWPIKLDIKS